MRYGEWPHYGPLRDTLSGMAGLVQLTGPNNACSVHFIWPMTMLIGPCYGPAQD